MKKLSLIIYVLIFLTLETAKAAISDAAYLALGYFDSDGPSSQRILMYFDNSGMSLGYVTLETSAMEYANSIAYGVSACPNLNGTKGMILLRDQNNGSNPIVRTTNYYGDPLLESGTVLPRLSPVGYGSIKTAKSEYNDKTIQLGIASDNRIGVLVNRYSLQDEYISSFIYYYKMPETATSSLNLSRDGDNISIFQRLDLGNIEYSDFCYGKFYATTPEEATDQIVFVTKDGDVSIFLSSNKTPSPIEKNSNILNVGIDGKDIISIWGGDDYTLSVLYSDNTIIDWDINSKSISKEYSFNAELPIKILDVVRTNNIVIPEPANIGIISAISVFTVIVFFRNRRRQSIWISRQQERFR